MSKFLNKNNNYSRSERIGVLIVAVIAALVILGGMCRSKFIEDDASGAVDVQICADSAGRTDDSVDDKGIELSRESRGLMKKHDRKSRKGNKKKSGKKHKQRIDNSKKDDIGTQRKWRDENVNE